MPNYTASITIDQVIDALATFLQPYVGSAEIVRAQVNRVPMPQGACVVLTELLQVDLETPVDTYDPVGNTTTLSTPARIDVQIDFYGPSAGDWCRAVKGVYRSFAATSAFSDGIKPLYCDDGRQTPLITGEEQWESRWTLTASLQYNAVVTIPQRFADSATPTAVIAADIVY